MISPTIPDLIARAAHHPFLGEHLAMGQGAHAGIALAHFDGIELTSAYEPIFDISVHGLAQSLSCGAEGVDRFGDELGFQAVTHRLGAPPFDVFDPFDNIADDQQLVALDRMSRALHAINFFGPQRHGLLFLRVHERLLKSVKYDHGRHFSSVLTSFNLSPTRIVIELPAAAVAHKTFLGYLTRSYQHYGFKVAGNLSNAGQILSVSENRAARFHQDGCGGRIARRDREAARRLRGPAAGAADFQSRDGRDAVLRATAVRRAVRARAIVQRALSRSRGVTRRGRLTRAPRAFPQPGSPSRAASAFRRGATFSRNTSSPIDDAGPLQLSTSQRFSRGSRNGTATAFTSSCHARNE
ncbi:hypothetical protein OKW50_002399 [Paraburkholderia youngii]